jgi:hypothetical protein
MARRTFGLATAAVLLLAFAHPASADGLSRFEQVIKPKLPAGSLTYKSAKALGDSGFVLEDAVVTAPPDKTQGTKAEPISIKRISVEDLDFAALEKDAPPKFAKVRIDGVTVGPKPAEGVDLKELTGLDKVVLDLDLDYRLDPDRQTMTLNRLALDLNGLGRLELTMILDGVSTDMAAAPDSAMDKTTLRTATLVYDDHSLLAKVVPVAAKLQGSDAATLVKIATAVIDGARAGQGQESKAALDAVSSFVADYNQPKGSLRITFNPPSKTSAASLSSAAGADDVVKALGLVVTYAGTVAKPPAPAAAAPKPAAAPVTDAAKPGCDAGARFFVYHEDAWWPATARKPAKADNQCVAKIEGGDDDITISLEKTIAWSIDGPGKAIEKCSAGDKILIENDGGWYPGKVTNKPFADGQCPVKYENPDNDDETVDLKRVRRLD